MANTAHPSAVADAAGAAGASLPPVSLLLQVDSDFRTRAAEGDLRKIAPERFNPLAQPWLPVLHVSRDGWDLLATYSNCERAHELGKTHDWVAIQWVKDGRRRRCLVVTETDGELVSERVIRGREADCLDYYETC